MAGVHFKTEENIQTYLIFSDVVNVEYRVRPAD
jgi:hypothetical protein